MASDNTRHLEQRPTLYPLLKASQSLNYFPHNIPDIDSIPVYTLSSIILDITHFTTSTGANLTYNIVTPSTHNLDLSHQSNSPASRLSY